MTRLCKPRRVSPLASVSQRPRWGAWSSLAALKRLRRTRARRGAAGQPRLPLAWAVHRCDQAALGDSRVAKKCSNFGVGIADLLHIMNAWEETPWRTLGGRRVRKMGSRWLDGNRERRSRARLRW